MVQVIKSPQDPLEVGNNLPGISDNVRERGAGSTKKDDDGRTSNGSLSTDEFEAGRSSDGNRRQTDVGG